MLPEPTTPLATSPVAAATTPISAAPITTTPVPVGRPPGCIADERIVAARRYAASRPGHVSFAVYVGGKIRSHRATEAYRSASLVKAMLLAADLRAHVDAGRRLSADDRDRLRGMITVSSNDDASATFRLVGGDGLRGVARLAGMRAFTVRESWGTSSLTAADQARLWGRLDDVLPPAYRAYGRRLLGEVTAKQTWGAAPLARATGYLTLFKSGWLERDNGWLVHQGLRLEASGCAIGLAVLTGRQPEMADGVETLRGIADALLSPAPAAVPAL